ncbi:hypothetical protein JCM14036_28020 [Desulfotomaculum defluvii]
MFFRKITTKKNGKEYVYIKLIENYRSNGKIKQRVVANFGSVDNLTPDRINDLIISLKKLHKDVEPQDQNKRLFNEVNKKIPAALEQITNSQLMKTLGKSLNPKQYQLVEAMVTKIMVASEINISIQDFCKEMGLIKANGIEFYNALKILSQDSTKETIFLMTSPKNKAIFIHLVQSVFNGTSFEMDIEGSMLLRQNYKKPFILLLVCDEDSKPLSFEVVEDVTKLTEHLSILVKHLKNVTERDIVVLDLERQLSDEGTDYVVARPIQDTNSNTASSDKIYFETTRSEPQNEERVKEIRANLAKVTAGLENIKADILLGKLSRESAVRKRVDSVIKTNGFYDMVNYQYHEATHSFEYQIKHAVLKEKTISIITNNWAADKNKFNKGLGVKKINIKTEPFQTFNDQLVMPPINMYVEYHYSTEIISSHVALEIIKNHISML